MTAPEVASTAQGEAAAVAGTAKDEAAHVASTATSAAGDVAGTAKQEAGHVLGETLDQAKNLTSQAKEQASQQLGAGSEKLTGSLRGLSEQLRNGDTSGVVGQVLSEAGARVQGLADQLERKGPQGVLADLQDYARRSPGTFLIGMAAAGFLTGRLVKGMQTAQPSAPPTGTGGYGGTAAGGEPLAGVTEPGIGAGAGYVASPYPDSTYEPVAPAPSSGYLEDPLSVSPLPVDPETRGTL